SPRKSFGRCIALPSEAGVAVVPRLVTERRRRLKRQAASRETGPYTARLTAIRVRFPVVNASSRTSWKYLRTLAFAPVVARIRSVEFERLTRMEPRTRRPKRTKPNHAE